MGYLRHTHDGVQKFAHVLVAERVLGRPLPPGAVVHHADGNRANNDPSNLVICPSQAYHRLLHRRINALAASGHADWRKCWICKQYDAPSNLYISPNGAMTQHKHCASRKEKAA
jgi:hypothetical protein